MDEITLRVPLSLTIDAPLFQRLHAHLFPGDDDEHGAILAAGIASSPRGTRLLVREIFLARDGIDWVPGERGYRALTAEFVAEKSDYCARESLCYLAVHNHPGVSDAAGFSPDDNSSHERGYPALLDITGGDPVGALVFTSGAVAGDIWTPGGRHVLDNAMVVGPRIRRLYPSPRRRPQRADPMYDRHARLFGDVGQALLGDLKVGIIGLGGGGSLVSEWLARLGVGHIVAVDFDRLDITNLPRVVGATRWDALTPLTARNSSWLQQIGKRFARHKVHIARRVARQASPSIRYDAIVGDVLDEPTAQLLTDVDFLFLASDTIQSRNVFNALVQQYLIPGAQIGVKIPTDPKTHAIGDITVATRLVLPHAGGGCLRCHELIPPGRLQREALTEGERRAQRYIEDDTVTEPSVITLNALSAAQAVNDLMMMFTGLYGDETPLPHLMHFAREREMGTIDSVADRYCMDCSDTAKSRRGRGDRARLPCRMPSGSADHGNQPGRFRAVINAWRSRA
jgi:tRNA A37 threonylcarbamoyladenosine dehydratase